MPLLVNELKAFPEINKRVLLALLELLHDTLSHADKNRMNATNLAICFSPGIFKVRLALRKEPVFLYRIRLFVFPSYSNSTCRIGASVDTHARTHANTPMKEISWMIVQTCYCFVCCFHLKSNCRTGTFRVRNRLRVDFEAG